MNDEPLISIDIQIVKESPMPELKHGRLRK